MANERPDGKAHGRNVLAFLQRLAVESECEPYPKFHGFTPAQVIRYIRAAIADDVMEER